jgi:hypothetical protein
MPKSENLPARLRTDIYGPPLSEAEILRAIQQGIEAADRGEFATDAEVRQVRDKFRSPETTENKKTR